MILSKDCKSGYYVYIAPDAPDVTVHAAEELCRYLRIMTGALLPLMQNHVAGVETWIAVGHAAALEAGVDVSGEQLGDEGYIIRTAGDKLVISGGSDTLRGDIYGVYGFLEDVLGVRFFTETIEHVPSRPTIELGVLDMRVVPALEYRETYYPGALLGGEWSVKNRNNGSSMRLRPQHGGKVSYYPFVHSFNQILDPEEWFDSHPEYFSEVDGVRIKENTQLCLTNPEVLEHTVNRVRQWLTEHPDVTIVSISQNDVYNPCTCEKCRAIDEREGSYAGTLISFINAVAERLEAEYPRVVFDTLAYQYTRKPPRYIRPRHNVCVRLCSIECCFAHPLDECDRIMSFGSRKAGETSASFQADLEGWSKVCDRLYIWDYVVNFYRYVNPFFNFNVLGPNIRYFIRNNVKGIFEEGASTALRGAEFEEMRAWILAKLMWNPELDTHELAAEFISGVYGKAAPYIKGYYDLLKSALEASPDSHFGIYDEPRVRYITPEVLARANELFDRAEAAADTPQILERVRTDRLCITHFELYMQPVDAPGRDEAVDRFRDALAERGIYETFEGRTFEMGIQQLRNGLAFRFPD